MDPLKEWFEYLDRVSRPVRRGGRPETEPAALPWRPWMEPSPEAEPGGALAPGEIPELLSAGEEAPPAASFHAASREAEDPTLHDELQPIPEFAVPTLHAPSFDVEKPALNPAQASAPTEEGQAEESAEPGEIEAGAKGGASSSPAGVGGGNGGTSEGRPHRNGLSLGAARQLLTGGPKAEVAAAGEEREPSPQSLQAREQLVQRLVDPTLTLEETALLLGVCPTTVRRYTNRGVLRHFRTEGNQRRFRLTDVLEFMEAREGPGTAASTTEGQQAGE